MLPVYLQLYSFGGAREGEREREKKKPDDSGEPNHVAHCWCH